MLHDIPAPAIFVHSVSLFYDGQVIFDRLSCDLPAAKTTCLLGRSGVGKTTLLHLISGREIPGVTLDLTVSDSRPLYDRLAYMDRSDLLLPWLTVLENALLGHRLRGTFSSDLAEKAKVLLSQLGLPRHSDHYPKQLSAGMRQRVALTRTLLEDRPVMLMDEPFSALDTLTRWQLQEQVADLVKSRTVLLVTHDPLEALRLSHRILIMTGRPVQIRCLELPGEPPRSLSDSTLLEMQEALIAELMQGPRGNGCHT